MTFEEITQEMIAGKKVTHMYFSPDEWMTIGKNGRFIFEDDVECTPG